MLVHESYQFMMKHSRLLASGEAAAAAALAAAEGKTEEEMKQEQEKIKAMREQRKMELR